MPAKIKCPHCDRRAKVVDDRCSRCGEELFTVDPPKPVEAGPPRTKCNSCLRFANIVDGRCPLCGAALPDKDAASIEEHRTEDRGIKQGETSVDLYAARPHNRPCDENGKKAPQNGEEMAEAVRAATCLKCGGHLYQNTPHACGPTPKPQCAGVSCGLCGKTRSLESLPPAPIGPDHRLECCGCGMASPFIEWNGVEKLEPEAPRPVINGHIIMRPEDCKCGEDQCPVCDQGLSICMICNAAESELHELCAGPPADGHPMTALSQGYMKVPKGDMIDLVREGKILESQSGLELHCDLEGPGDNPFVITGPSPQRLRLERIWDAPVRIKVTKETRWQWLIVGPSNKHKCTNSRYATGAEAKESAPMGWAVVRKIEESAKEYEV